MMSGGDQQQVLAAEPFEAGIARMDLQRELSLGQPAMQRFGINGEQTATVGDRQKGHQTTPFVLQVTRTTTSRENSRPFCRDMSQEDSPGMPGERSRENSWEDSQECSPARSGTDS